MHLKCRVYLSSDVTLRSLGNTEAPASATIRVTILDHHIYTLVATGFSVCLFPDERLNLEVIWVNVQNFQYIGNKMFAHQPVYSLRSVSNAFVCCTFVSKSRTAKPTHDNLFDIWITFFFFNNLGCHCAYFSTLNFEYCVFLAAGFWSTGWIPLCFSVLLIFSSHTQMRDAQERTHISLWVTLVIFSSLVSMIQDHFGATIFHHSFWITEAILVCSVVSWKSENGNVPSAQRGPWTHDSPILWITVEEGCNLSK